MVWLGETRGHSTDWVTQLWVRATGHRLELARYPWLAGPVGDPRGIGREFFAKLAQQEGLNLWHGESGLLQDFSALAAPDFLPDQVHPSVRDFYTRTSAYELDAWAEWCGLFRPFGHILARLFSRRLQQLNVPLSGLDTSQGVTSEVVQLVDPVTHEIRHTAWIRQLLSTGNVLYAGAYSLAEVPRRSGLCVKVVFPLPNGNAMVLMRPEAHQDGSFSVVSAGREFGDPGFYFTVRDGAGRIWARYVRALKETIRIFPAEQDIVHADHVPTLWGATFLRLHYRLRVARPLPITVTAT